MPKSAFNSGRNRKKLDRSRIFEALEARLVLSAAFDVTGLTKLRNDANYSDITGSGVGIAVLDSGIYASNPDLQSNVKAFYNAVENAVPTSIDSSSVSSAFDNEGHGTHVAGIAASSNPSIGVAYQANVISVKVIADSGESSLGGDPLLRGLQFVAKFADQFNIKVVNMSLGEVSSSGGVNENSVPSADDISAEIKVLEGLGITVVTASGNSYANDPEPGASYPAVVSSLSVASTWADSGPTYDFSTVAWGSSNDSYAAYENSATADIFSATSQRSTLPNQVAAPGVNIFSTWNNSSTDNSGSSLLYNTLSGTSMATPFVSGLVALIQQAAYTYGGAYLTDVSQIVSIVENTSDKIVDSSISTNGRVRLVNGSPVTSKKFDLPETGDTYDRVDVYNAIAYVRSLYSGNASTADINDTRATATALPSVNGTTNYTRTGAIGTDGVNSPGANDVDLYSVQLISPGTFSLKLGGSTPFAATIRLFDSSGNQIAIATGTSGAFPTLATDPNTIYPIGTYYIGISSAGNDAYSIADGSNATGGSATGSYALTVGASNPDPNGVAQGAVAVDLTDPTTVLSNNYTANEFSGILGSDPATDGSSDRVTVPDGDVDMFKVVAPDSGTLTIQTSTQGLSSPADTYLVVYDANLNQVAANDDISSFDTDSRITLTVTSGATYYVAVTNYANRTFSVSDPYNRVAGSTATPGNYTLDFTFDNGDRNGTAFLATNATVGGSVSAAIGSDSGVALAGANGGNKDVDFYAYSPRSSGLLDLTVTGTGSFQGSLALWTLSSDGTSLTKVGESTGDGAELVYQVAGSTTYYVSVTGVGNDSYNWYSLGSGTGGSVGNYTLASSLKASSQISSLSDGAISYSPQTLSLATPVYDNLGQDAALIVGSGDVDLYRFTPTATGNYDFRTDTSREGSADTVLRLFDAGGNQIAINDNLSSSTTASFIRAALTAGTTYYLGVSGTGNATYNASTGAGTTNGSTGSYGVMVAESTAPVVNLTGATSVASPAANATTTVTYTVSFDLAITSPVTVDFATADGSAKAALDYRATSGTLTFNPGDTSRTVSVVILNDAAATGATSFSLTLSNASGGAVIATSSVATSIYKPVISIAGPSSTPAEPRPGQTSTVTFTVTLDQASTSEVDVNYATADGTALAGADYTATSGTLSFLPGETSKSVVVTLLSDEAANANRAFAVTLAGPSGNATLSSTASSASSDIANFSVRTVTFTGSIPKTFTDSQGRLVTLRLSGPGTGVLTFLADAVDPDSILLSGTTLRSALSIVAKKGASLSNLSVTGDLKSISAATTALSGSNSVSGSLGAASIASATGSLSIGGAALQPSLSIKTASNFALTSAATIKSIASTSWAETNAAASSLTAPSIAKLVTKSFAADLHLTSASTNIASGSLGDASGTWTFAGSVGKLSALSLTHLSLSAAALGSLSVTHAISASSIRTTGNIRTVTAGTLSDSTVFAGVGSSVTTLPSAAADLAADATIGSLTIRGEKTSPFSVQNSDVAAAHLGKITFNTVNPANGGAPFGLAAETLVLYKRKIGGHLLSDKTITTKTDSGDAIVRALS